MDPSPLLSGGAGGVRSSQSPARPPRNRGSVHVRKSSSEPTASMARHLTWDQRQLPLDRQRLASRLQADSPEDESWWESLDCDRCFNPHYTDSCRKEAVFTLNEYHQVSLNQRMTTYSYEHACSLPHIRVTPVATCTRTSPQVGLKWRTIRK